MVAGDALEPTESSSEGADAAQHSMDYDAPEEIADEQDEGTLGGIDDDLVNDEVSMSQLLEADEVQAEQAHGASVRTLH